MMIKDSMELSLLVDFQDFQRASNCTDEIGIGPNNVWPCQRKKEPKRKSLCHLCVLLQPLTVDSSVIGFRLVDFLSENIIVGSHGVPDPPSLAKFSNMCHFRHFLRVPRKTWPSKRCKIQRYKMFIDSKPKGKPL